DVTCEVVGDVPGDEVPIGRPIDNARLYVLDPARQPVALGEAGELHVGGEVLAAGYLHRPDLTAGPFLPDPSAATPRAPAFAICRTGGWSSSAAPTIRSRSAAPGSSWARSRRR